MRQDTPPSPAATSSLEVLLPNHKESMINTIQITDNWRITRDKYDLALEQLVMVETTLKGGKKTGEKRPEWQEVGHYSKLDMLYGALLEKDALDGRTLGAVVTRMSKMKGQIVKAIKGQG